ncbi:MAG: alkaline phosphatase family protein, partial [Gaiellales bacterium]
ELHRIPDVLIDFGERPYVASDRLASSAVVEPLPAWGGGGRHRRHGILVAMGPGVGPGRIEGADITDICPTVLHAMGLAVPDDVEGRVLTELFSDGRAVETAAAQRSERGEAEYSDEEAAAIEASLRGIGYL